MSDDSQRPIIVKRIKKSAHGHHGGAWKIAYADFVTAMMAFFLLMWLLGSTAKGDLNGIAEYFSTPLKVAMQGGSGSGDASSVIMGGGKDLTRAAGQVREGETVRVKKTVNLRMAKQEAQRIERMRLTELMQKIEGVIGTTETFSACRSFTRTGTSDSTSTARTERGAATAHPATRTSIRARRSRAETSAIDRMGILRAR